MKRVMGVMVCCVLLLSLQVKQAAAQKRIDDLAVEQQSADGQIIGEGSAGEKDAANTERAATLSIDNQNVYEGMKKAYKNGYIPSVSDNKVILILPLITDGELQENELTAGIDLGATEHSPFTYKNYEKTVSLSEMPVNGTDRQNEVYYIRFDLSLEKTRYNGIYPVTVAVSAKDINDNAISQSFTIYISITDGKETADGSEDEKTDAGEDMAVPSSGGSDTAPVSEPVVLVSACSLNPDIVDAGNDFTATVTIKNTNEKKAVRNMVITVDYDSGDFTFLDASESIYVTGLEKGNSMEIPLHFHVNRNTQEGNYKITLHMNYDNADAVTLSSTGSITIPVRQTMEVELTVPRIAGSVTAGDTLPLDFQVMNLGRSKVYNVRCNIEGDGLVETGTAFIGNLEGGTEGNASMNLFISTKAQQEKYGKTEGMITMTYEDAEGKEYTKEFAFTTAIEKPPVPSGSTNTKEETSAVGWWISVSVTAVITAGMGIVFAVRKRKENEWD